MNKIIKNIALAAVICTTALTVNGMKKKPCGNCGGSNVKVLWRKARPSKGGMPLREIMLQRQKARRAARLAAMAKAKQAKTNKKTAGSKKPAKK